MDVVDSLARGKSKLEWRRAGIEGSSPVCALTAIGAGIRELLFLCVLVEECGVQQVRLLRRCPQRSPLVPFPFPFSSP